MFYRPNSGAPFRVPEQYLPTGWTGTGSTMPVTVRGPTMGYEREMKFNGPHETTEDARASLMKAFQALQSLQFIQAFTIEDLYRPE